MGGHAVSADDREILAPVLGDEQAESDSRLLVEQVRAARHPAARTASQRIGVHRVLLQDATDVAVFPVGATEPAEPGEPWPTAVGWARVPAVYALECHWCGALLRPGPTTTLHLQRHRDEHAARRPWWRRLLRTVRGTLYRITHTNKES